MASPVPSIEDLAKTITDAAGLTGKNSIPNLQADDNTGGVFKKNTSPVITSSEYDQTLKITSSNTLESNSYKIHYYPEELIQNGDDIKTSRYPQAMAIFINVNTKSKLGKSIGVGDENKISPVTNDISNSGKGSISRKKQFASQGLGNTSRDNESSGDKNLDSSALTTIGNDAINSGGLGEYKADVDYLTDTSLEFKTLATSFELSRFRRFKECIFLPLPLNLNTSYSAQYSEGGATGVIGSFAAGMLGGNGNMFEEYMNNEGNYKKDAARAISKSVIAGGLDTIGGLLPVAGQVTNSGGIFDKVLGTVANPRIEQIFGRMATRSFNFSWNLAIFSIDDWNSIKKIIQLLKENMHPELDDSGGLGTYMIMPNEFDIEFHHKPQKDKFEESPDIPKIRSCVLTGLDVNYTPHGSWVAFEGTSIPPFVQLNIQFTELEPLHREMIKEGGY